MDKEHEGPVDLEEEPLVAEVNGETKGLILLSDTLPTDLPIIPLRPRPAFPGLFTPMGLSEKEQIAAVRRGMDSPYHSVGLVLLRDPEGEVNPENLHRVGVAAKIVKVLKLEDDETHILVNCLERFTVEEASRVAGSLLGRVTYHHAPELSVNSAIKAHSLAIIAALKELVQISPLYGEEIKLFLNHSSMSDPGRLADFAANLTSGSGEELQEILETFDVFRRINRVLVLLKKELEVSRLQTKIAKQIEEKVSAKQREFFLKEQFKALKKELGLEKEGKTSEIDEFRNRLSKLTLTENAQKVVEEELQKFQLLEPASPEYNVTRTYLDWLTVLPWGRFTRDSYNLKRARRVLDRDHYGLDDVKERILEFIAVGKMKGDISGSILCLVGPPGTGKTSVGRSIADALGRTFYRFSLGGMRDEAEIKGHRRTYVGAMPGKFLQAMKTAAAANPVLMLDEIDKIGASFQGDPASALLEVLDPEQNAAFRDHYLDVPFDLSNVLFVATANQLDTIPAALLDRMEVIRLSGYIRQEKVEIARRYLVPKALKGHGLTRSQVSIRKPALVEIAEHYAREAGVRQMEKLIKKIMRKASLAFAEGSTEKATLGKKDVETYLGKPLFAPDGIVDNVSGVVTGLAWTNLGGVTLQVEAAAVRSKTKGLKQTGQLGDVMVESSEIAYSYLTAHTELFGIESGYFDDHFIHLHVPAGATPKDGPSAGITMATALLSLATGTPVRKKRLGMTGELTLTGRVLPIGGLKEKTVAARRAGLRALIFPEGNRRDFEELPDHLKEGLEVHFVEEYPAVHKIAFGTDSP